jgi:hypothetical protein
MMMKKKTGLLNNIQKNTQGHNQLNIKNIYYEWTLNQKDFKRKIKDFSKEFLDVVRQGMMLLDMKAQYQINYED